MATGNQGFLIFRADGHARIGLGHVMRCLALAQAWQAVGGESLFILAGEISSVEARLQNEGVKVAYLHAAPGSLQDAAETLKLAEQVGASWIVVDGYHFDSEYQKSIKGGQKRLLFIDDTGQQGYYSADIILNQNLHAQETLYPGKESYTKLLLGPAYVLLRREFSPWLEFRRQTELSARRLLVTLGGADPDNVTLEVLKEIERIQIKGLEIVVIAGGSNLYLGSLRSYVASLSHPVRLESNVSDMPQLMAWADLAISAGGATCWELAFMGLPHVILVIADNQVQIAESLNNLGVAFNFGWPNNLSEGKLTAIITDLLSEPKRRGEMSDKGRKLVDGLGAQRVLSHLCTH